MHITFERRNMAMEYEGLCADEQAFLNSHDGDRELEQARWMLM